MDNTLYPGKAFDSQVESSTVVLVSSKARMWNWCVVFNRNLLLIYGVLQRKAPHMLILPMFSWVCSVEFLVSCFCCGI